MPELKRSYIGCSGYHYSAWKGPFYPDDIPKKDWLGYYAERFNSVEINNSFYKVPDPETFESWKDQTPATFRFTLKGSRYITHMKKLKDPEKHLKKFYDAIEPLGDKTRCILWQLPGNLHEDTEKLDHFCSKLSQDYTNVLEFRHQSWFSGKVGEIISGARKCVICSLSAPGDLPEDLFVDRGITYVRFHGKDDWYRHDYSDGELEKWAEKIAGSGTRELYAYFNNDVDAHAPVNAQTFREKMEKNSN